MTRHREADLSRLTFGAAAGRATRVAVADFARPLEPAAAAALLDSLPDQLAARALRALVERIVAARRGGRPVLVLCGGHVIKTGIPPCLIEWLDRGVITHLALNGAAALHDVEIARMGRTSEDVEANLQTGAFGMVSETGEFMGRVTSAGALAGEGLGECLGRALTEERAPHLAVSLLGAAWRLGIPATVHVAIGADTVHFHPLCDGAALGATTHRDFRILAGTLAEARGAAVLNLGSAVVLPEVFLKALTVARNLGASLEGLTTANLDQVQHYRPRLNVVERPTMAEGARGFALTGHHEILFPLLAGAVLARLD